MISALGVNKLLTQKLTAFRKLRIELIVEVVSIGQYNDGRRQQRRLEQMRVKHHRQRLSAALCVPEHAALSVRFGRSFR